jgi:hypothetical protein
MYNDTLFGHFGGPKKGRFGGEDMDFLSRWWLQRHYVLILLQLLLQIL